MNGGSPALWEDGWVLGEEELGPGGHSEEHLPGLTDRTTMGRSLPAMKPKSYIGSR